MSKVQVHIHSALEVTPAIEEHIQHYADKLERYSESVLTVDVHLKKESKTQFSSTVLLKGKSCTANSENMYNAITKAFDKIEAVLAKDKSIVIRSRNKVVQKDLTTDEE